MCAGRALGVMLGEAHGYLFFRHAVSRRRQDKARGHAQKNEGRISEVGCIYAPFVLKAGIHVDFEPPNEFSLKWEWQSGDYAL